MNYAELPTNLAERRALGTDDCTKWTPRDLLLHFLKRIDEGENFYGMQVVYVKRDEGGSCTGSLRAQMNFLESIGALDVARWQLIEG